MATRPMENKRPELLDPPLAHLVSGIYPGMVVIGRQVTVAERRQTHSLWADALPRLAGWTMLTPSPIRRCAMQKLIMTAILVLSLFAVSAVADEFTGWISDSKCGVKGASADHKDCAASRPS